MYVRFVLCAFSGFLKKKINEFQSDLYITRLSVCSFMSCPEILCVCVCVRACVRAKERESCACVLSGVGRGGYSVLIHFSWL